MTGFSPVRGASAAFLLTILAAVSARADMRVESFASAPTADELASFKSEISALEPGTGGNLMPRNDWAQHASGQRTRAMGLIYEMTHDQAILDRMIVFCDAVLAARNDLAPAPTGQHTLWTGNIEPAWPNNTDAPIATAGEQGDPIGHLGYCARLILETPAVWSSAVAVGDPHGYGGTYRARAQRFVDEADRALDEHMLAELLDLSNQNRMYWGEDSPASGSVPWNQQMMFNYALQNLAGAHRILDDDPARAARYDAIVQASVDWFFSGEPGSASRHTNQAGRTVYVWAYRPPSGVEDWSHANLDVQGLYRAYQSGRYGISEAQMTPLANTLLDVIRRGPGDYAGRVDGTDGGGNSAPTTTVRPGWYVAALFRPDDYVTIVSEDLSEGGSTRDITRFAYYLWVKCNAHPDECIIPDAGSEEQDPDAGPDAADAGAADAGEDGGPGGSDGHAGDGDGGADGGRVGGGGGGATWDAGAMGDASDSAAGVHASCGCRMVGYDPGHSRADWVTWLVALSTAARRRRRCTATIRSSLT
jgi:hypothetical protein